MLVNEIFYSIQGEGIHAGKPAVFLRLTGCNLHCWWCDTKYTWMFTRAIKKHVTKDIERLGAGRPLDLRLYNQKKETQNLSSKEILDQIVKYPCKHIVITGGEPLLQLKKITTLVKSLKRSGWFIEIETNGTIHPKNLTRYAQFNVSPKLASSGNEKNLREKPGIYKAFTKQNANSYFKFVLSAPGDIQEVCSLATEHKIPKHKVLLMPQATNKKDLEEKSRWLAALAKSNGFRFSTRLHVALYGNRRGV